MNITVCGTGPAGLGMAACLADTGHTITLYELPDFAHKLTPYSGAGAFSSSGRVAGTWPLAAATTDPERALRDAEVVFVVMHAAAHKMLGRLFAPFVRPSQLFVLCPGYVGGSLELAQSLKDSGAAVTPPCIEASSLPITAAMDGSTAVVKAWKHGITLYCSGSARDHEIAAWFERLYGPVTFTTSPLEPGLNEINIIVHAVTTLLNPARVDSGAKWIFYREGLSPAVIRVIEAIDAERVELERALGLEPRRLTDMLYQFYKDQGMASPQDGLYTQLSTFASFASVPGPNSFDHRFISEDVRFGLVPMYSLGTQKGVPMPATRAAIELASLYTGQDELKQGRIITL